jgi:hypothetical protein
VAGRQQRARAATDLVTDMTAPVVLSRERAELAAAIAKVDEWEKYISHCRDVGLANLDAEVQTRARTLVVAEDALKELEAAGNAGRSVLRRAINHEAASSPEAARRDVEVARAAWNESFRQRSLARTEIQRMDDNELRRAQSAKAEAIRRVILAEGVVDRLLRRYDELQIEANAVANALRVVQAAIPYPRSLTWDTPKHPNEFPPDTSISAPLRLALVALETDPAAPLPPLPGGDDPAPQLEAAA